MKLSDQIVIKKKQNDYTNHIYKLETIIMNQEKALAELKKEVLQNKIYTNVFPDKHDAIQGRNINDEDTKGENNNTSGVPYIRSTNSRCYLQQSVLNRSKIFFYILSFLHCLRNRLENLLKKNTVDY